MISINAVGYFTNSKIRNSSRHVKQNEFFATADIEVFLSVRNVKRGEINQEE